VSLPIGFARDQYLRLGRWKGGGVTYYTIPGVAITGVGTINTTGNVDEFAAWYTPVPIVIDQLAFEVTTPAAQTMRVGFYAATVDWAPTGAPFVDSGAIDVSGSGVKTYTPGTPLYVPPGRYVSVHNKSAAGTLVTRSFIASQLNVALDSALGTAPILSRMQFGRSYAAFTTPGTAFDSSNGFSTGAAHTVVYRVTAP
jgi:hypothetical protein